MSDATGGAAAAALAGGDNAAPGAASAAGGTQQQQQPAANDGKWTEGWEPADAGIVEKKGWQSPKDLFKSYRELEKTLGSDKLIAPKDANDTEAYSKIYDRLGRPESADKYKFPDGVDASVIKEIAPQLHKLGISQAQAEALAKIDLARSQAAQEAFLTAAKQDSDAAMVKLEGEWGAKTAENIEFNRRAMRSLGITVDEATKYMASGGAEKFMRLLNAAGKAMREEGGSVLRSDDELGFGMTANRAAAEIAEMKADKALMQRIFSGKDRAAERKWKELHRMASGSA